MIKTVLKLIGALLTLILFVLSPQAYFTYKRYQLNHADHAHILTECREMIANRSSYRNDRSKWPSLGPGDVLMLRPIPENVPKMIRELHPRYIIIRDNNVLLSFNIPFVRVGLIAFQSGARQYGTQQYIDGLWFWTGNLVNQGSESSN